TEPQALRDAVGQEVVAHVRRYPAETLGIAKRPRQALSLTEIVKAPLGLTERKERVPELEPKVDGLPPHVASVRQMRQGGQCLFEIGDRLPIGRARHRLDTGLPRVQRRFFPQLTADSVAGEAFDLLRRAGERGRLEGVDDPSVQCALPVM